jgi:TIR domain-containing protein
MTPGTVFISHRAEYGKLVHELERGIEKNSRGKIDVFISEEIPRGAAWRAAIEAQLQNAESLFLVYGAPYEDWSWCF